MTFPKKSKLNRVRKMLEEVEPVVSLSENATKVEKLKYELCRKFVIYLHEKKITQAELAKELKMDRARLNEIVKYKIENFTLDKLIEFTNRLEPNLEIVISA